MRTSLLSLAVLLGGCASSGAGESGSQRPPRPAPRLLAEGDVVATPDADPALGEVLGWVAGQPISERDLLLEWRRVAGRDFWLLVDQLVATRLAYAEAGRLELELSPERIEARFLREKQAFEDDVLASGEFSSVQAYIGEEFGQSPEAYYRGLRSALTRQMVVERVVRAWSLTQENRALRIAVLPSEDEARELIELVRGGADLAQLARERSVDETARHGGLVPYLVRQDLAPLARMAFDTPVGEIGGPLAVSDHYLVCRVEEERQPQVGPWSDLAEEVEASLARHPVGDSEFLHWKLSMEREYPVDLGRLQQLFQEGA